MGYSMRLRGAQSVFETNKTLRNTFFLLALSLLPTIGGVFLGTAIGLPAMMASSPWLFLIGFLVAAFLVIGAIHATSESGIVFVPLTALTLMMGAVLSGVITATLKFSNGPELITLAFAGTIAMLAGCGVYASTTKRYFSSMGGFLFG
jgi:modulator of FtsH protease